MRTYSSAQVTAMNADRSRRGNMPCFAPGQYMSACAAAASQSSIILKTDVIASVSLFALVVLLAPHLLLAIILVVLISLLLTGLTRLVGLDSLVGQISTTATRNAQGV